MEKNPQWIIHLILRQLHQRLAEEVLEQHPLPEEDEFNIDMKEVAEADDETFDTEYHRQCEKTGYQVARQAVEKQRIQIVKETFLRSMREIITGNTPPEIVFVQHLATPIQEIDWREGEQHISVRDYMKMILEDLETRPS